MEEKYLLLLKKILYKSNLDRCGNSEDMQYALEKINEMIETEIPDLEEEEDLDKVFVESETNIEDFLKNNGFELSTYYQTNKRYRKEITECQSLYVRIYSNVNRIQNVQYEDVDVDGDGGESIVSFETIDSLEKLKKLLKSL